MEEKEIKKTNDCPLCEVSEETIKKLKEASEKKGKDKNN